MKETGFLRKLHWIALFSGLFSCILTGVVLGQKPERGFYKFPDDFDASIRHYFDANLDSAEKLCYHAIRYYDSLGRPEKAIVAHLKLSELYQHWRFNDLKAYTSLYNALLIMTENPQISVTDPYMFVNLGNILFRYELYERALASYSEALNNVNPEEQPNARVTIYQNIAQVFLSMNQFDSALIYLKKAQLSIRLKTDIIQAQQFYNMSEFYFEQHIYDSALFYARKNQQYLKKIKPLIEQRGIESNILVKQLWYQYSTLAYELEGDISLINNQGQSALENYRIALPFTIIEGLQGKQSELYNKIGVLYLDDKNFEQSLQYGDSAFRTAYKYKKNVQLLAAARLLEKISNIKGDRKLFEYYTRIRAEAEDSLTKQKERKDAAIDKMRLATASLEISLRNLNKTKQYYEASLKTATKITRITWILSAAVVVILLLLLRSFYSGKRTAALNQLFAEKELEETKIKLALKNRELASKAIRLAEVTEYSAALYESIENMKTGGEEMTERTANELNGIIDRISSKSAWKQFEENFEQVHEGFYKKLLSQYPDLSPAEIKICSLLKTNMSTKDIAILTNRSIRTIENTRNSIRRKMSLPANSNLVNHLLNF